MSDVTLPSCAISGPAMKDIRTTIIIVFLSSTSASSRRKVLEISLTAFPLRSVGISFEFFSLMVLFSLFKCCSLVHNFLTGMSRGGVNDPLQRSRLKIQFAFGLGIRYASHLSPVVNRIRTTRFQSILNRYLRRWWSIQPLSKRREPFAHR